MFYLGPSLTLGLMGLDELHLRVLSASSEDPVERSNAKTGAFFSVGANYNFGHTTTSVLKLLTKGRHWVLVVRSSPVKKS
jgi:metal transporter CNNM